MEVAFGQGGTLVTPLQQAVAYSTFANGGTRYAPQLATAVVSAKGKVVRRITPQATGKVTYTSSDYTALMQGFEGVIAKNGGTGYQAFVGSGWNQQAFPLGGKTGTASVNNQEPTSWFVSFGPLPTSQYVVVCVINQGGYGVDAAAPVVRNIFNYLAVHPITAPGIPPVKQDVQATTAIPLPTPSTTTSTTTSSPG
jgi:penicillin-binding protein 2